MSRMIHDEILNDLEQRILKSGKYAYCYKNMNYYSDKGLLMGEIDMLAVKEGGKRDYLLLFEIKGGLHCRRKAESQLLKEEIYFSDVFDRIFKFYVHKNKKGNKYEIEWDRKI